MATQQTRTLGKLAVSPSVLMLLMWMLVPLSMTIYFSFLRYNLFGQERRRCRPDLYPDKQTRMFPLYCGWKYVNQLHETLSNDDENAVTTDCGLAHIYHYGYCQNHKTVWLRHENYRRLKSGEPEITEVPEGMEIDDMLTINSIPFRPPHPLL